MNIALRRALIVTTAILTLAGPAPLLASDWHWQNPLPQGNLLTDVAMLTTDIRVAVGYGGTILRTTDAGTTWKQIDSGTTEYLRRVAFTDVNTGTAVGSDGTILRTSDGGLTWTPQPSGTVQPLYGVSFVDANRGTVVGWFGTILHTADGGVTWTPQTSPTIQNLFAVSFIDKETGFAALGRYRARLHSALELEDALVRHPKLRVYIMHAGWPMLDDLLAVLWVHPQVHVDVGFQRSCSTACSRC